MDENQTMDHDRIMKINIEEEMKSSYIDYSMSVIVARALPDVRDGFKPVHRPPARRWRSSAAAPAGSAAPTIWRRRAIAPPCLKRNTAPAVCS